MERGHDPSEGAMHPQFQGVAGFNWGSLDAKYVPALPVSSGFAVADTTYKGLSQGNAHGLQADMPSTEGLMMLMGLVKAIQTLL